MSTDFFLFSEGPYAAETERLLRTASQQPWGPGREIDAKVHFLHQVLLGLLSRLGSAEERPEDARLAHEVDHDLRNKLMIFQYHEEKRRLSAPPFRHSTTRPRRSRFRPAIDIPAPKQQP